MYLRLSNIDGSHYHSHVIHALAYATKGHWHATRTLCRVALRTADGLPDSERGNRKGREAAYLLAIAERRLAVTLKDLDMAKKYLDEAEAREDAGVSKDSRFLSEEIAVDVAKLNFQVFVANDLSSVLEALERLIPSAVELLKRAQSDPLKPARVWVSQQVLTNALNLALIARDADLAFSQTLLEDVRALVSAANMSLVLEGSAWPNRDDVAEFVYLIACIVFGIDPSKKHAAMVRLEDLRFPAYTPFDKAREAAFRQLAARADLPERSPY